MYVLVSFGIVQYRVLHEQDARGLVPHLDVGCQLLLLSTVAVCLVNPSGKKSTLPRHPMGNGQRFLLAIVAVYLLCEALMNNKTQE